LVSTGKRNTGLVLLRLHHCNHLGQDIKKIYEQRMKSLDDSTIRLFSSIHFSRFVQPDLVPTDEDILLFRSPTDKVTEIEYMVSSCWLKVHIETY